MQTVYPSSNHAHHPHAHHPHNNCVHRNIYQLHYNFKDLIYMRKIVSALETTLGLDYGYAHNLIRFVTGVDKIHACKGENYVSTVLSCFLVHILRGVMISEPRKLFEKHTSSSTGESKEQGALSPLSVLQLPPAASDCAGKVCQQRVCRLTHTPFSSQLPQIQNWHAFYCLLLSNSILLIPLECFSGSQFENYFPRRRLVMERFTFGEKITNPE